MSTCIVHNIERYITVVF